MFDVWPTVGEALGIGRTSTYALARDNALPIPTVRVGRQLRARRSDLLHFLGITEESDGDAGESCQAAPDAAA
ncbi:helix-turn-helix domain-containing protein [Streptomyces chumphonensis]|uniref:Helix-turn-helix domain-containing protein n=1 Tax=Streptomyces chumphonensis TaxID=1214925 RepID=A0A927F0F2_9ACTN|nr:helix-turn-helix domain-containing protein [Streptomyces chumphonensis]MBD3931969.1 helix-turn-helix domain-containing protein [Streptomyces chumphonensis]